MGPRSVQVETQRGKVENSMGPDPLIQAEETQPLSSLNEKAAFMGPDTWWVHESASLRRLGPGGS